MLSTLFEIPPISVYIYLLMITAGFFVALYLIRHNARKQSLDIPLIVSLLIGELIWVILATRLLRGPIAIHSYGLMIAVGFLLALHFMQRDARKRGLDGQMMGNIILGGLFVGVAGTRILHILMFPRSYAGASPLEWFAIWNGGLVFQGAIPAVILYGWWATRKYKLGFWTTADLIMPYVPLAHAFGRLGCFMHGCCYGGRTDLPCGICFPRVPWNGENPVGSPPFVDHWMRYSELANSNWSYPVHPTQLYGAAGLLLTCGLLLYLRKHWHPFDGFTLPAYFVLYSAGRIVVEFFRGDHNPTVFGVLSMQQVFSVAFLICGIFLFLLLRKIGTDYDFRPGNHHAKPKNRP